MKLFIASLVAASASAQSLGFDFQEPDAMTALLDGKLWYSVVDASDLLEAYSPTDASVTNPYSGYALNIVINNGFITNWPHPDTDASAYEFVSKWSGACMRDVSSGAGGFCLLEDSDVLTDNTMPGFNIYFNQDDPLAPVQTQYVQNNILRSMMTFRVSEAQFDDDFEPAWDNQPIRDDTSGLQDGRSYYYSIQSTEVDKSDSSKHMYLDYAYCEPKYYNAAAGTSSDGDDSSDYWYCQIYLNNETYQSDGYPAMQDPGVIAGYYVASYIPDTSYISYYKAEQVIQSYSGASALTASAALLTAAFALAF